MGEYLATRPKIESFLNTQQVSTRARFKSKERIFLDNNRKSSFTCTDGRADMRAYGRPAGRPLTKSTSTFDFAGRDSDSLSAIYYLHEASGNTRPNVSLCRRPLIRTFTLDAITNQMNLRFSLSRMILIGTLLWLIETITLLELITIPDDK